MAQLQKKIKWSFRASLELVEIHEWITDNASQSAADKYLDGILDIVNGLSKVPERYAFCRSPKLQAAKVRCINYKKKVHHFLSSKKGY